MRKGPLPVALATPISPLIPAYRRLPCLPGNATNESPDVSG
ncbi:MAG: hypothetical protein OJF48_001279 [Afipia sp.]|nr:MAG: hypothetical protein OJF48_001279 [Afipia sp.]